MQAQLVVLVRIGLFMLSGRAVAGGWLPAEFVPEFVSPAVAEAATGVLIGGATFIWYCFSQARKALDAVQTKIEETFR